MAVYDIYGNEITAAYSMQGNSVEYGYSVAGDIVFQPSAPSKLKIMSYNVQQWTGNNSLTEIQDIAFGDGADIVGIQEWGTSASMSINGTDCLQYLANFGYVYSKVSSLDRNHKAVASKIFLATYDEIRYSQSYETRSLTKSYFEFNGKRIALFNTHLDVYDQDIQFLQASELYSIVTQEPYFILVGDLNIGGQSKDGITYQTIVQPYVNAGYNVANSPDGEDLIFTFYNGVTPETSTSHTPPDNIITSPNIDIDRVYTIDTKFAGTYGYKIDHVPLVAELIIH